MSDSVRDPSQDGIHRFDAGDLGCADGLAPRFKERLNGIRVGEVLQVITADPAAKSDLGSLARLMGNEVRSVETLADGRLAISVERKR